MKVGESARVCQKQFSRGDLRHRFQRQFRKWLFWERFRRTQTIDWNQICKTSWGKYPS